MGFCIGKPQTIVHMQDMLEKIMAMADNKIVFFRKPVRTFCEATQALQFRQRPFAYTNTAGAGGLNALLIESLGKQSNRVPQLLQPLRMIQHDPGYAG
jgi:hypothetical protein